MITEYKVITITHKSADLKDIGRFVLSPSEQPVAELLKAAKAELGMGELLYLATCNRILYFFCHAEPLAPPFLQRFMHTLYPGENVKTSDFICHEGLAAIRHLFEVSSSVDSLVVGEREIIRQLRQAYAECHEWRLTGDSIRLALKAAIQTGKRVYARTRIGEKQVSVVSLAIKQLMDRNPSPDSRILLVGAGQTNVLVGKFLKKYGFRNVHVFNRTLSKAEALAAELGGAASGLDRLADYGAGFDCMIVCTGATEPVIHSDNFPQLLAGEASRDKIVIDLSIPNNVHADTVENFDFQYIAIEGLKVLAQENLAFRGREVARALDIITDALSDYEMLYRERQLEKALGAMPQQIKAVKAKAMNEVFAKEMQGLDDDTRHLMSRMLDYMEKKCIGIPMKVAKDTLLR